MSRQAVPRARVHKERFLKNGSVLAFGLLANAVLER
jgi:hypothetical protein